MIYLFFGQDNLAVSEKVDEIKKNSGLSQEAASFDYDVFYGHKLEASQLKKALLSLPAMAQERIVLIHSAHKLSPHNKNIIIDFSKTQQDKTILILACDATVAKNAFFTKLKNFSKVVNFSKEYKYNVFDMTKAITARNATEALKILHILFGEDNHPLQVMGGLVWYWGHSRRMLTAQQFKDGLYELGQADLNIKRSRVNSQQAVEIIVVRLVEILQKKPVFSHGL